VAIAPIPTQYHVQQGNGEVYLSWSLVAGATSYSVQRSTDGVTYAEVGTPSVNNYLDDTVSVGTLYYYKVASVNGSGTSPYTSPQQIIPALTGQLSLASVRLASQQRADRVNSNFVTLPEWNSYINQSYFELYDLLVTLYEDYYLAEPVIFQTDGTNAAYALPNGTNYDGAKPFYKLQGVDCGLSTTNDAWVTLKKYDFIARNRYVFPNLTSTFLGVFNMQYRVMGDKIRFIPLPSGAQYIRLWYIPRLTELLQDTDILDGISGWDEYVIVDAAIKALQKEESDVSVLLAQKMALKDRIESSAMNRDAGEPDTISNTRAWSSRWGGLGGDPSDGSWGGV
jgi:hypothetical protein